MHGWDAHPPLAPGSPPASRPPVRLLALHVQTDAEGSACSGCVKAACSHGVLAPPPSRVSGVVGCVLGVFATLMLTQGLLVYRDGTWTRSGGAGVDVGLDSSVLQRAGENGPLRVLPANTPQAALSPGARATGTPWDDASKLGSPCLCAMSNERVAAGASATAATPKLTAGSTAVPSALSSPSVIPSCPASSTAPRMEANPSRASAAGKPALFHHPDAAFAPLRILLIGDSVDQLIVQDMCEPPASHAARAVHQLASMLVTRGAVTDSRVDAQYFHRAEAMVRWVWATSPTVCTFFHAGYRRVVTIGAIFNKPGVHGTGPWNLDAHAAFAQLGLVPPRDANIAYTFKALASVAIRLLAATMGGVPHAVIVNSCFWDLARMARKEPRTYELMQGNSSGAAIARQAWLGAYRANVTLLVNTAKTMFDELAAARMEPAPELIAWRTANRVIKQKWAGNNWYGGGDVIDLVNSAGAEAARSAGMPVLDLREFPGVDLHHLRDAHHPSADVLVDWSEHVVGLVHNLTRAP